MKDGVIEQVGTPNEVYKKPNNIFVASFIGTPAMNFFEGKVKSCSKSLTTITLKDQKEIKLSSNIYKTDQDILFGIRPEDISVNLDKKSKMK